MSYQQRSHTVMSKDHHQVYTSWPNVHPYIYAYLFVPGSELCRMGLFVLWADRGRVASNSQGNKTHVKPKQQLRFLSPRIPTGLRRNLAAFRLCITCSLEDDSSDNVGFLSRYRVPASEQVPAPVTALEWAGQMQITPSFMAATPV